MLTLITIPPIISNVTRNKLIKYSDYYLQIDKVSKGYDDFVGSINIIKEVEVGAMKLINRGQTIWGLKLSKRELLI